MNMNHRQNGGNCLNQQQPLIQTMNASTTLYAIATTNAPTHESKAAQQQRAQAHHTASAAAYLINSNYTVYLQQQLHICYHCIEYR